MYVFRAGELIVLPDLRGSPLIPSCLHCAEISGAFIEALKRCPLETRPCLSSLQRVLAYGGWATPNDPGLLVLHPSHRIPRSLRA